MPSILETLGNLQAPTGLGRLAASLQPAYQRGETYKVIGELKKEQKTQNMTDFITEILPYAEKGQKADQQMIMNAAKKYNIAGPELMAVMNEFQRAEKERQVREMAVARNKRDEDRLQMEKDTHPANVATKLLQAEKTTQDIETQAREDLRKQAKTIFDQLETDEALNPDDLAIINKVPEYKARLKQRITGEVEPEYYFKKTGKEKDVAGAEWVTNNQTGKKAMVPKKLIVENPDLYERIETPEEKSEAERGYKKHTKLLANQGIAEERVPTFEQYKNIPNTIKQLVDSYGNPAQRMSAFGMIPPKKAQYQKIVSWLRERQNQEKGTYLFNKGELDRMQRQVFAEWGVDDNLQIMIERVLPFARTAHDYDVIMEKIHEKLFGAKMGVTVPEEPIEQPGGFVPGVK